MEFEGYKVVEEIARGGMGVVYKAHDLSLGRFVAIKVPSSNVVNSPSWQRLLREAKVLAQLRHANVVRVLEVGERAGRPYIVMEWIEGQQLSDYYRLRQSVSPETAVSIVARLAEAVDYLHQNKVLHRDLKPENVMLGPAGEPTLVDFGIAQDLEGTATTALTVRGKILGTPLYASPEQLLGELDSIGPLSDVFGLGAILYFLLSGRSPRGEPTSFVELLSAEIAPLSAVPKDLAAICLSCLAQDPQARPPSAAALAQALTRWSLTRGGKRTSALPGPASARRPATIHEDSLEGPLASPGPGALGQEPPRSRPPGLMVGLSVQTLILLVAIALLSPSAPPPNQDLRPLASPSASPAGPSAGDVADLQAHLLLVQRELKEVRAEQKALAREQLSKLEALSQAPQAGPRTKRPAPRSLREAEARELVTGAGPAPQILVPRTLQNVGGGRYKSSVDGSILVWIPGGTKATPDGSLAKLEKGVFMGVSEVSWGQYLLFCQATGWKVPSPTIDARARGGRVYRATANDPVFNVSFADAKAYLEWAGLRLPSEREWRFAALECEPVTRTSANVNVADLSRDWRWGAGSTDFKEQDAGQGNDGFPYLAPVQFFHEGRSRSGCYGLLGNLSEWVSEPAPEAEAGGEGRGPLVFCGASWYLPPDRARWNYRFRVAKTFKGNALGFRVALSSR